MADEKFITVHIQMKPEINKADIAFIEVEVPTVSLFDINDIRWVQIMDGARVVFFDKSE